MLLSSHGQYLYGGRCRVPYSRAFMMNGSGSGYVPGVPHRPQWRASGAKSGARQDGAASTAGAPEPSAGSGPGEAMGGSLPAVQGFHGSYFR